LKTNVGICRSTGGAFFRYGRGRGREKYTYRWKKPCRGWIRGKLHGRGWFHCKTPVQGYCSRLRRKEGPSKRQSSVIFRQFENHLRGAGGMECTSRPPNLVGNLTVYELLMREIRAGSGSDPVLQGIPALMKVAFHGILETVPSTPITPRESDTMSPRPVSCDLERKPDGGGKLPTGGGEFRFSRSLQLESRRAGDFCIKPCAHLMGGDTVEARCCTFPLITFPRLSHMSIKGGQFTGNAVGISAKIRWRTARARDVNSFSGGHDLLEKISGYPKRASEIMNEVLGVRFVHFVRLGVGISLRYAGRRYLPGR